MQLITQKQFIELSDVEQIEVLMGLGTQYSLEKITTNWKPPLIKVKLRTASKMRRWKLDRSISNTLREAGLQSNHFDNCDRRW